MLTLDDIRQLVRDAFRDVPPPPPWCLANSLEGEEPRLLERDFAAVRGLHWSVLEHTFLDRAPGGFGTALSFFSDQAFRFYLPAYLLAALDGSLQQADPVFHLTHGLCPPEATSPVNPLRFGARTWRDAAAHRLSVFTPPQASAIRAFLLWTAQSPSTSPDDRQRICTAVETYWGARAV